MNYDLIQDAVMLTSAHEKQAGAPGDPQGGTPEFGRGVTPEEQHSDEDEPVWEGKKKGRSVESMINTLLIHMSRYARNYSRAAIYGSDFSTQDEFIYLINLHASGAMTKMGLIRKNIQDKSVGMQIINRLISKGWIEQTRSAEDRRSKMISITQQGHQVLDKQMDRIRQASKLVTGDLTSREKMDLVRLLLKLDHFHHPLYNRNVDIPDLLDSAEDIINHNGRQK